ncbi:MAG: GNAT family N-acetyltransferase [Thalassotalea sp.]
MKVKDTTLQDYPELLALWENSVRATHDFITEQDITSFKPMILEQAFPVVSLKCIKNNNNVILGFIGIHQQKVEMLFILNEARGQGIGKKLMEYAIAELSVNRVDVNEQNPLAIGFYQHLGFKVTSRSPVDDMGKPFPILHLKL